MPLRQIAVSLLLFVSLLIAAFYLDSRLNDDPGLERNETDPSTYSAQSVRAPSEPFMPREYVRIKK
ncbi:hypothetical protein [Cohnella sp.]|uniref:hypothetical protein n=1 Tax=Cohnella sp. TaxID=1883426 RepID=UPI00356171AC